MNTQKRYSPEFRERAVRLTEEQQKDGQTQWAAIQSISQKLGCYAGEFASLGAAMGAGRGQAGRFVDG
jgi:transposase-like protein